MNTEQHGTVTAPGSAVTGRAVHNPDHVRPWSVGEPGSPDDADRRIEKLRARSNVDREMIINLQAEQLMTRRHAEHLAVALQSSRMIGAAVGIVMTFYGVSETAAFEILKKASRDGNRKLRILAEEVVLARDVTALRPTHSPSGSAPR